MRDLLCEDTIAAISTAPCRGAIGIVRISGKRSLEILKEVFRTKSGKRKEVFEDRKLTYGVVVDERGEPIDEVLAVYMKAPKTFTGEDIVEINSHGGIYVERKILETVLKKGARLAEPGEFTFRAFLNGKIDLVQAEAINDIVNASTETSARLALNHLEGKLSRRIKGIRDRLLEVKAYVEAAVDFPEEEVEIIGSAKLKERLREILVDIERLLSTYRTGRILSEGIRVAIVGRPNVGKSSLLNTLLQEERAIVTEIPGTTRDIIEESVNLKGVPVRLVDTAGIREAVEKVERIGIERSIEKLKESDVVLFMIDGSEGFTEDDRRIEEIVKSSDNFILVINKKDLGLKVRCRDFPEFRDCVEISAKEEKGVEELTDAVFRKLLLEPETALKGDEALINSIRQKDLLEKAGESVRKVISSLESGYESPEFLSMDIDDALKHLGEIVGEVTTEDMLDIIFSRFCIGK